MELFQKWTRGGNSNSSSGQGKTSKNVYPIGKGGTTNKSRKNKQRGNNKRVKDSRRHNRSDPSEQHDVQGLDEDFVDRLASYGALRSKYSTEESRKTVRYTLELRHVMDDLKAEFKVMTRESTPEGLLQNVKLLVRSVIDRRDLLEIVNAGSSNESLTALHKQVRIGNVMKIGVLVERLPCLDIAAVDKHGRTAADMASALSTEPGDMYRRIHRYLKEARKSSSITGVVLTPTGHLSDARQEDKRNAKAQRKALLDMITAYFNKIDGLYRLRKIVKDASAEKIRKHMRKLRRSLCELCELSHVIDIKNVDKPGARTALQKAMERTDRDRDSIVRALIEAGASSRYLKKDDHVREANEIARICLIEATKALTHGDSTPTPTTGDDDDAERRSKRLAPLLMPVKPVFGSLLAVVCRRDSGAALTVSKRLSASTLPIQVPNVVRQCGEFLRTYGLLQEGIFRIPGAMGRVETLKNIFNTTADVNLKTELVHSERRAAAALPIGESVSMQSPSYRRDAFKDREHRRRTSFPELRTDVAANAKFERHSMTVATLLKCFFRELQCPIIDRDVMERLQRVVLDYRRSERVHKSGNDDDGDGGGGASTSEKALAERRRPAVENVREILLSTDRSNQICLAYLFDLLAEVAANANVNKMTPKNLAVCWAPSLSFHVSTPTDLMATMQSMTNDRHVVEFLITCAGDVFPREETDEVDPEEKTVEVEADDSCASPRRITATLVPGDDAGDDDDDDDRLNLASATWRLDGDRDRAIRQVALALNDATGGSLNRALDVAQELCRVLSADIEADGGDGEDLFDALLGEPPSPGLDL